MATPGSIFISYRRSDSSTESGRVYDKLAAAFGSERIFKDVYNIPPGYDFVTYLEDAVAQCEVLLPLIGATWLTTTDARGDRRIDDPHDFVRIEIASALKGNTLVIPILLNGTLMPSVADLPADLQPLTRRNAVSVRQDPDFHPDMERLIASLQDYFASQGSAPPPPAATVADPAIAPTTIAPPTPAGDAISAHISGNMSGNIAVGKNITQTQTLAALPQVSEGDRAQLHHLLDTLTAQIAAEAPADKQAAALEHLEELQETLTSAQPDPATMEYIVKWFNKKLPQLAMYVVGTLLNPIVAKVCEAAGTITAEELRQRFSR